MAIWTGCVDNELVEDRERLMSIMQALVASFPEGFATGQAIDVSMQMNFECAMCMLTALKFASDYLEQQNDTPPSRLH